MDRGEILKLCLEQEISKENWILTPPSEMISDDIEKVLKAQPEIGQLHKPPHHTETSNVVFEIEIRKAWSLLEAVPSFFFPLQNGSSMHKNYVLFPWASD